MTMSENKGCTRAGRAGGGGAAESWRARVLSRCAHTACSELNPDWCQRTSPLGRTDQPERTLRLLPSWCRFLPSPVAKSTNPNAKKNFDANPTPKSYGFGDMQPFSIALELDALDPA